MISSWTHKIDWKKYAEEQRTVTVNRSEEVLLDFANYIDTLEGKAWYYERIALDSVPADAVGTRMCYVELANHKFKCGGLK